jgi:hypothetical protein
MKQCTNQSKANIALGTAKRFVVDGMKSFFVFFPREHVVKTPLTFGTRAIG